MRREQTSVSQEDYLKAIWELVQEEQAPIGARLAEELGVTPPAVTAAVKRMARDGYVRVLRNGHISLSPKGQKIAEDLVLRHRLAEKLLTDVIGLPWARAHEEAEKLEHGISAEVAELLVKRFGRDRSEEYTSELQSPVHLVCGLLLEKKKKIIDIPTAGKGTEVANLFVGR